MPRPIISPSVLASDFGQLTAECKRMIKNGADWLHMGKNSAIGTDQITYLKSRCYGWVTILLKACFFHAASSLYL
jgi:hypothetical protein